MIKKILDCEQSQQLFLRGQIDVHPPPQCKAYWRGPGRCPFGLVPPQEGTQCLFFVRLEAEGSQRSPDSVLEEYVAAGWRVIRA